MLVTARVLVHLRHLRFGHFAGKNPANALPPGVDVEHHLYGALLVHAEEGPQHLDDEIHRGEIVIHQQHLEQRRSGYFRPCGIERKAVFLAVFLFVFGRHGHVGQLWSKYMPQAPVGAA